MEPENLQSVLQEAGIQVDMKNLQNPTEDFMIYLITEYLNKFNFDGNEISKSTIEQLDCVSCPDSSSDAITLINLYSSLSTVCNEIFLKDFCLSDITSPGPKRARRQIKILLNFLAYVRTKMVENEIAFVELDNQQRDMEEMIDKRDSIIAKTGAVMNDRENKIELCQQLQQEIEKVSLEIDDNSKKSKELECDVQNTMIKYQEANKNCKDLKAKAVQLHKIRNELESQIVKSPQEYAARLKELKKVLEVKKEERQVLNDSITRKKIQIKNNENAQELIKDLNDKFLKNTNETCKQIKETSEKLECVQKELNILKVDILKWTNIETNNSIADSKNEDQKGHEQLLFELDNQYMDKQKELYLQNNMLEELMTNLVKNKAALENDLKTISVIEEENSDLIKQYKKYFENEISEELALQKTIKNTILKNNNKNS